VIGEQNRRHFQAQNAKQPVFKPGCKMIEHMDRCPDDVILPKRRAQLHTLTFTAADRYRDRRHLTESDMPSTHQLDSKDMNWTRKKVAVDEKQQMPVSQLRSSEYNLEGQMTRKQRISGIDQQRNEIPIASFGDKAFKIADSSPGFFAGGGLIAGSTIRPRPPKQFKGSQQEEDTLGRSIKSMTAMEKRSQYINDSDKRQVDMLTVRTSSSLASLVDDTHRIRNIREANRYQVGKKRLACGSVDQILMKMRTTNKAPGQYFRDLDVHKYSSRFARSVHLIDEKSLAHQWYSFRSE
jgi:hypothetical protein